MSDATLLQLARSVQLTGADGELTPEALEALLGAEKAAEVLAAESVGTGAEAATSAELAGETSLFSSPILAILAFLSLSGDTPAPLLSKQPKTNVSTTMAPSPQLGTQPNPATQVNDQCKRDCADVSGPNAARGYASIAQSAYYQPMAQSVGVGYPLIATIAVTKVKTIFNRNYSGRGLTRQAEAGQ